VVTNLGPGMMVVAKEKQHVVRSGLLEKEQIPKCELLKIQQNPPKCRLLSLLYVFSQDRSISKHRKSTVFFFSCIVFSNLCHI
jgi:hypothetical protein